MTAQEFEQFLHDAEIKLARLKALYEQWFQGIERTEPVIVRKDLDRSLELLKKNMPRNTALRFRTQQLSARYGTYGIYWGRIGRQIEEGTYKRILARVNRTSSATAAAPKAEESGWEIEVDIDEAESGSTGVAFSEGDLDAILGALTTEEKPKSKTSRSLSPFGFGAGMAPSRPPAGAPVAATFGKPVDAASKTGAATPIAGSIARPRDLGAPASASTHASTKATPLVPPAPSSAPASVPRVPPAAPVPPPSGMRPAAPGIPRPPAPVPVSRPPAPAVARPSAPSGVRPAPSVDVPRPAAAPPVVAPRPIAPAPQSPSSSSLDEGRMRAIHASYVDARRKNNEGADVRYETLAESVAKMIPKLREKHGGKAIDFEVVVQNGKVGLKPKVSG